MTLPPPSSMRWMLSGLCRDQKNAGLFDEPENRHPTREERRRLEQATRVCTGCPVRDECLAFGLTSHGSGVHGGFLLRGGKLVPLVEMFARGRRIERACGAA